MNLFKNIDEKNIIKNSIDNYFNNGEIVMTKLKQILDNNISLYYAKIGCLLCIDNRYLVAITENDNNNIGTNIKLKNLNWISFQTRTLDDYNLGLKSQDIKNIRQKDLLDKIYIISKKNDRYIYESQSFPIKIELLLKNENTIYSENGTIHSALETYNCVINFD